MSSTLTNLLPLLYAARDKVSREQVGMIPSVMIDAKAETAAKDQVINVPVVPSATSYDITPGDNPADNGDVTPGNVTMSITKSKQSPVRWEGEEEKQVMTTGIFNDVHVDRIAQAMRVLTNEIETDLATEGYQNTSGGYGTVATVPFGSDLTESAYILKTLKDRGGHHGDTSLVFDSTVGANFLSLTGLTNVNEAGTSLVRDQGVFLKTHGMSLRESGQIQSHTAGTGAAYTTSAAGFAVGTTSIPIITGTGTVLDNDMVTFAGDDNKYTVKTGVAAPGTIVLEEPGLLQAIPASATAMTIVAAHTANLCFDRNAIALLSRAPAMPSGGDAADDVINIADPIGGITYQVALYRQYRRVKMEIAAAWGVKAIAPRHISRLIY
jgi:hypothetical protein